MVRSEAGGVCPFSAGSSLVVKRVARGGGGFLSKRWLSSAVVGLLSRGVHGLKWCLFSVNADQLIVC